jgi:hypothetical protein
MTLVLPTGAIPSPHYVLDRPWAQVRSEGAAEALEPRWMAGPMPPAMDQGQTPQCTTFATALMRAFQTRREPSQPSPVFDTAWIWARQKEIDGLPGVQGSTLRAALTVAKELGFRTVGRTDEAHWKIADFGPIPPADYAELRAAIRQFGVILWAGQWDWSWFNPVPPNEVLPAPWEPPKDTPPGHAVALFGYDDRQLVGAPSPGDIAAQSSWGDGYGHQGRVYMPARYLAQPGIAWEAWWATDLINTAPWSVQP